MPKLPRVSTLWTSLCFDTAHELRLYRDHTDDLSIQRATNMFMDDLRARGVEFEVPDDPATDQRWVQTLNATCPLAAFTTSGVDAQTSW